MSNEILQQILLAVQDLDHVDSGPRLEELLEQLLREARKGNQTLKNIESMLEQPS